VKNYVMRKFVFRGPSCAFICCVELKVAVLCHLCYFFLHTSSADSYCNISVREVFKISGFSLSVVKVQDCMTA
jgi:hypothetical protein